MTERNEAIQLAEATWKEVWRHRPVSDAEELRSTYSRKAEIFALITEHARLSTALAQAEEQVRTGEEEQERIGEGSGSIQELESLKTPLLTSIDQYSREWETTAATRRELNARLLEIAGIIRDKQVELDRLATRVGKAGENELADIRTRRDHLWQLIRASAVDKTLSSEDAQKQSEASVPLAENFGDHLRRADEIADLRFANAKDVAIHDRLVKEIDSAQGEHQRIETELARREGEERELRQRWTGEWDVLGSALLSPAARAASRAKRICRLMARWKDQLRSAAV